MHVFSGIVTTVVLTYLMCALSRRFGEKLRTRWTLSSGVGIFIGLIVMLTPAMPAFVSIVFLFPILAVMGYLIIWWRDNGSTIQELINIILIDLIVTVAAMSAVGRIIDGLIETAWLVGLIRVIPWVLFSVSIVYFIFNLLYFRDWLNSEEFDPECYLNGNEEVNDFEEPSLIKIFFRKVRGWWYEENITGSNLGNINHSAGNC